MADIRELRERQRRLRAPSATRPVPRPFEMGRPTVASSVLTVKLVRVLDDHLECETFGGKKLNVLKPDLFRYSRWNGKKRSGVTMSFASAQLQQLTATKPGAKTEVWKITPPYIGSSSLPTPPGLEQADWLKIATLDGDGKTDFNAFMQTLDIAWYDTNEAGRVWGLDIMEF